MSFLNSNLTIEFIDNNKENINWQQLWGNPYLTPEMIDKYEDKIDFEYLSINKGLTIDIIIKYIDKLDIYNIISNILYRNYHYLSKTYIKKEQKKQFNLIKDELLAVALYPDRVVDWCMCKEEQDEINKYFKN